MNVNHRSSSLVTHLFLRLHQPEAKYRTPFALATPFADLKVSNIRRPLLSAVLLLNLLLPSIAQAGRGRALLSLDTMAGTPFPSDLFTVADPTQNTGLRVNLPKPDCLARPSDCQDRGRHQHAGWLQSSTATLNPLRWPDRCDYGYQRNGLYDQSGRHTRSERPGWSPCRH